MSLLVARGQKPVVGTLIQIDFCNDGWGERPTDVGEIVACRFIGALEFADESAGYKISSLNLKRQSLA